MYPGAMAVDAWVMVYFGVRGACKRPLKGALASAPSKGRLQAPLVLWIANAIAVHKTTIEAGSATVIKKVILITIIIIIIISSSSSRD